MWGSLGFGLNKSGPAQGTGPGHLRAEAACVPQTVPISWPGAGVSSSQTLKAQAEMLSHSSETE